LPSPLYPGWFPVSDLAMRCPTARVYTRSGGTWIDPSHVI
jgi:hypothetical protein